MKKFYVTFRKLSRLRNHYAVITAYSIKDASSIANEIFKNVDKVFYEEKFTRAMYYKGRIAEVRQDNFLG